MSSALAKTRLVPGLRVGGSAARRTASDGFRLRVVVCAKTREQLQIVGLEVELLDVVAAPCPERVPMSVSRMRRTGIT